MSEKFRKEKDVLGEVKVPIDAYWGVNTQRAIQNFQISDKKLPNIFTIALAQVKKACLLANIELELIDKEKGDALLQAIDEILIDGKYFNQFPIDVFQTGSGTQTNMNMNEVLANRANQILGFPMGKKQPIHPNDHVNKGQSSNDVIPTAMHVSAIHSLHECLIPSAEKLIKTLEQKIVEFEGVIKVGRTHLQDAVPIPLALEFKVYLQQVILNTNKLNSEELLNISLGGTALGTGINAPNGFAELATKKLSEITNYHLKLNPVKAEGIASHNVLASLSSSLRLLALSLIKMANDVRWMGSGPRAGLGELILPANEPGSSIMPGKINPTQSEALIQVCLQVIGNDTVISTSEAFGSILDLNICKPLIIYNLLESINILSGGIDSFVNNCLIGLKPNKEHIDNQLKRMLMVVTNLSPYIGYDKCSEIAQKAYRDNKTIKEVVIELGLELDEDLDIILDPKKMV